jgi:hypothetical protein
MKSSPMLTIQYLEDSPTLDQLDLKAVVNKLRAAAERLPITHLLIGWNVPPFLLDACRSEAERLGIRFLRWHPLLTADKRFRLDPTWQTEGLMGDKLVGYHGMPEFTFFCPNHPAVQEAVYKQLIKLVRQGVYQGFFLDRVRFPSPSTNPASDLGCFCEHCQRKAAEVGLDLGNVQRGILQQIQDEKGRISLTNSLLSGQTNPEDSDQALVVRQFLAFRKRSVRDFLALIVQPLRDTQMEIGLDCFSPSLTHMVGQDLHALSDLVDWIKLMTYAHTLGPAGLPYELSGFLSYINNSTKLNEKQSLDFISQSIDLRLPNDRASLIHDGLSSLTLEREVKHGIELCSAPLLAGIELVELEGVTQLSPYQIKVDLTAVKQAKPAGLAISWDLLNIPLDRLDLVRQVYLSN